MLRVFCVATVFSESSTPFVQKWNKLQHEGRDLENVVIICSELFHTCRTQYTGTPPPPRRIRHGRWLCSCGTSHEVLLQHTRPSPSVVVMTACV
jgi:hypothetical protein